MVGMEERSRDAKRMSPDESVRNRSGHWFLIACFSFAFIKIAYLFIGYARNLYVQSYEDLARFWFSWNFNGLKPIAVDICWLPLHPVLQSLALAARVLPFFSAGLFQTAISSAGGIFAALIAYDLCQRNWKAGVGALAAWLGSDRLLIMGIGSLSEPLLHLGMLATILFGLKFVREGKTKWQVGTLLSIYALELTRYEGWFFSAALFLLWSSAALYCRWRRCGHGYLGLQQSSARHIILYAGLIAVPPLAWVAVNYFMKGDPFYFISRTKENLLLNMPFFYGDKVKFLLDFTKGVWLYQPVVVLFGVTSLLWLKVRRDLTIVVVFSIFILYCFNFLSIMTGSTAFSFPERLSSNVFVLFCPLFGLFCGHFARSFRKEAQIVFPPLLLSLLLMGCIGFWTSEPVLTDTMEKNVVDHLVERLDRAPQQPRPRVLIETTKFDYSIVLFAVALDRDDWLGFNSQTDDSLDDVLAQNTSIQYLVLNNNRRNIDWIIQQKVFRLVAGGSVWVLYEYRKDRS